MKEKIRQLKEDIKGRAEAGRKWNALIQASSGPTRASLRASKAGDGWEARLLLLLYAAARGIPYRALEPRCFEDSTPYLKARLVREVADRARARAVDVTQAQVEAWIAGPSAQEAQPCAS